MLTKFSDFNGDGRTDIDSTGDSLAQLVGAGVPAANAIRVAADGAQTPVPVLACSGTTGSAVPIDVSGDPVYLGVYGPGSTVFRSECSATPGRRCFR